MPRAVGLLEAAERVPDFGACHIGGTDVWPCQEHGAGKVYQRGRPVAYKCGYAGPSGRGSASCGGAGAAWARGEVAAPAGEMCIAGIPGKTPEKV